MIVRDAGCSEVTLSIAVVDDSTIHRLNREFLDHDEPTDVISFVLEREGERLDGEVIASAETAIAAAREIGWPAADELLLYVIHGTLHLVGFDDLTAEARAEMRGRERHYLALMGVEAHVWSDRVA